MQKFSQKNQAANPFIASAEETKRERHQRLFRRGLKWLTFGVFLLGSSFVVTFLLFESDRPFKWLMYSMTSLGAVCVFKGLYDMFG